MIIGMMIGLMAMQGCGAFMAVTGIGYLIGYETAEGVKATGDKVEEISDERKEVRQERRENTAEVLYAEGEIKATLTYSTRQVWHATRVVLAEEGWGTFKGDVPKKNGEMSAINDEGEKVIIKFKQLGVRQSEIGVRFGLQGDPGRSQALIDKITAYLENHEITTL